MPLTAEEAKQAAQRPPEPVHPPLPAGITVSKCPLMHGSVGAGPFPGYVHGKHPAICKYGCEPDPLLGAYGRKGETPKETLIREAIEWQVRTMSHILIAQSPASSVIHRLQLNGEYAVSFSACLCHIASVP